jgi:PAS domain S-box-containing protein
VSDDSRSDASDNPISKSFWSVLRALDTAIAVTEPDGTVIFANAPLTDLMGLSLSAIVGSAVFALFDHERRSELERLHAAALSTFAAQRAETSKPSATGAVKYVEVIMHRCDQSNKRFIVWSITDTGETTPNITPQVASSRTGDRGALLDLALRGTEIGLWDWDIATDNLTWINNWCEQWGLTAFAGSGHERLWTDRIHEDDLPGYQAALESHLTDQTHIFDVEYRMRNQHESWVWVQERGRIIERDTMGRGLRMVGFCLYVDEHHRTAEALAQSESRFELALWGTHMGFWDVNAVTDEMHWWNDWCASIDVDPCEGLEHTLHWNEQIHPDDLPFTMSYEALIEGRADVYEAEYRLRTRNGGWLWVLCRGRATARDGNGRALRVAGVTIDIDARKRTELALRESDVRLKAAVWGTDIGLWESGPDGDYAWFDDWNDRFDIEECRGPNQELRWRERIHAEDIDRYVRAGDAAASGLTDHYVAEYRILTRSGAWRWIHERGKVSTRDPTGKAQHFVGVCLCVDEQKKLEAALRAAENQYELAVSAARLPVWEYDVETDTFTGNNYWHHAVGRDPADEGVENRKETWLSDVHPEDIAQLERVYAGEAAKESGFFQAEYRIQLPNGDFRWLLDRGRVVERTFDGQPLKVVGISVDIDIQKRLQAALREGEARLETAVGGSDIGLWDWAVGSDALRWLSDWPLRKGIKETPQPSTYQDLLASAHPENRKRLDADARDIISGGRDAVEMDYRIQSLQGEWRWIQVRAKVVERDRSGRAQRIVGACIDVDARRRTEEMLRTQATILETMREGVVLFDRAGRIELTNPAFERLFHCTAADLTGFLISDFLHERQAIKTALFGGDHQLNRLRDGTCDVVFRRKDDSEFTGEVVTAPIALASGERRLAVVWDISERKRLEEEILDIANSERRRLGHELHDGLCQELAGVALMLRSIATNLQRDVRPTDRQLEEIVALVNNAIENARAMAHGLSPVTLDGGGLEPALKALVRRARETYRISVRLRLKVSADLTMNDATASHLYRITQEAINNAVKHGGARAVTVTLQGDDYNVRLSVSDDGIGLPADTGSGPGMGLKIMDYRARLMGGVIDVAARRGGGTRVQCTCPAPARGPQNAAAAH